MKNYIDEGLHYITDELQKQIDWDIVLDLDRYAGGHDDQMQKLFKDSEVIAHWNEGNYDGMVATCVKLADDRYVIYNDYYGSCSGCDSWEGASDEDVRAMCINLANGAYVFENLKDVIRFLEEGDVDGNYDWFSCRCKPGQNLLVEIKKSLTSI